MTDLLPAPPPPAASPGAAAPDSEAAPPRPTRKRLDGWDRMKLGLLLAVLFTFLFWRQIADNPLVSIADAFLITWQRARVLEALFAVELVRQLHYLAAERSPGWHHLWSQHIFGRWDRFLDRRDPWTRYRAGRVAKLAAFVVMAGVVLGATWGIPFYEAIFDAPSRIGAALFSTVSGLPFIFQIMLTLGLVVGQFAMLFWFLSRGGVDVYRPDDVATRFDDVWGQDPVLGRVRENILFLEDPKAIEDRGGHVPSGILLWGPPGTGKTLMAEAVAGETGRPFVFVDPGAFTNMFMGVGIIKVKSLFRKLRKLSLRYGGVIVFFDEADSLGNRGSLGAAGPPGGAAGFDGGDHLRWLSEPAQRAVVGAVGRPTLAPHPAAAPDGRWRDGIMMMGGGGGGGMGTLQALLTELSGLKKPRGFLNRYVRRVLGMRPKPPPKYRILVMMATNMPQALDEALLRPGRIDRIYKVGYPSKEGRRRTFQGYLDKVSHTLTDIHVDKLAVITPYATGASIKDMVNEALVIAIREGRDAITYADVIRARQFKQLGPGEDVEYVSRERHAIAIHEACHAVAAWRLRRHMEIDIATIEKGGSYLGMVASIPPEDQFTRWRLEYEVDIKVALASLVGERLFFDGDNSSGVSGDLDSATTIATLMEGHWGMGSTLSSQAVARRMPVTVGGGGEGGAGSHDGMLERRVEDNLGRLYDEVRDLLERDRLHVLALAHALETYRTLSGEDVAAVMEGRPGPVVDGRAYATPTFAADVERYHALAAEAHRGHATIAAGLPNLGRATRPEPALVDAAVDGDGDGTRRP